MTETNIDLSGLLATQDGGDFLRGVAEAVPRLIVEADGDGLIGAGRHERTDPRDLAQRVSKARSRYPFGHAELEITEAAPGQLCPRLSGAPQNLRDGPGGRHPRGLERRLAPATCRWVGTGHGSERGTAFLDRPLTGDWPYLRLDATYPETRQGGRIVSGAAIIAVAAKRDGQRERSSVSGLGHLGQRPSGWTSRAVSRPRGLDGPKLAIGAAHRGLRAAIERVCERCRVHWMRNALGACLARLAQRRGRCASAGEMWRMVAIGCAPDGRSWRNRWTPANITCRSIMAFMTFPGQHRKKLHSTSPVARLDKEVKRRADVVGIVPNEASIARPVGAGPFEQNDEWQTASG